MSDLYTHVAAALAAALSQLPWWAVTAGQALLALVQIGLLWLLVRALGLGGDVRLADADHARALAAEADCTFVATAVVLDKARIGALLRDTAGRVLLIRRHGNHFVARALTTYAGVRLDRQFLTIATPDRHFGTITLNLGPEAQIWAASLRRLESRSELAA